MRIRWTGQALVGVRVALAVLLAGGGLSLVGPIVQARAAAVTNTVSLEVVTAFDSLDTDGGPAAGDPIDAFQFIINEDNTGDPTDATTDCEADATGDFPASFPDSCDWPSLRTVPGSAPIVTQGDQDDIAGGLELPDGRYLVSVTAAGHKISGAHFTVPLEAPGVVRVEMGPHPSPLATLRVRVFNDDASTNGQLDLPAETGLVDDPANPGDMIGTDMSGFTATISDWADEVTTDWYGNPLCTEYERDGNGQIILDDAGDPTPILGTGGLCLSDEKGDIVIPNLGANRYAVVVAPPEGSDWVQTTTLEGGQDWDYWALENETGYDTEFQIGNEQVPWVTFGYVHPRQDESGAPSYYTPADIPAGNTIKGTVGVLESFWPPFGSSPYSGTGGDAAGFSGGRITGPVEEPYLALSSIADGDRVVWVGRGAVDGTFEINGVRDGDYTLTVWDYDLRYILDLVQVTVRDGQVLDVGVIGLTGWFTDIHGHVFLDRNENGRQDPGEPGVPDFGVVVRQRANNIEELGGNATTTAADGAYELPNTYPLNQWLIVEAYSDRYRTTGVTYQASNQSRETTVRGSGVDVNMLPIIGQSGRLDWGVVPYSSDENGGIVGTVFYDTTRNELDPQLAATEDWAPGIPGLTMNLYAAADHDGDGIFEPDGPVLQSVTTETWERPEGCIARDANGRELDIQEVFPVGGAGDCIEAPLTGVQFGPLAEDQGTASAEFGASVDGNYGFGDLEEGLYIVEVEIPDDPILGRPLYKVEDEASINVFEGDQYTPQNTSGTPSMGGEFADNTVPGVDRLPVDNPSTQAPAPAAKCMGAPHVVHVDPAEHPAFADAGGSPYEGVTRLGCERKLVRVLGGRSVAPLFNLYTDVPIPARYWGLTIDDLNVETRPNRSLFGEKAGLANNPVGIYDWSGRLITTIESDPNGLWEVLLPSTTSINCATPSGVCPNMYRFVGNDPGGPGRRNPGFDPQYRTIAANFQGWPGVTSAADTAPTRAAANIISPGSQFAAAVVCAVDDTVPQLFTVSRPYIRTAWGANDARRRLTAVGDAFGDDPGQVELLLGDMPVATLPLAGAAPTWTNEHIGFSVPPTVLPGIYQLRITTAAGVATETGVSIHVLGAGYSPQVREVGPGKPYSSIQAALDAAAATAPRDLVVVYPGVPTTANPSGAYYENIVMYEPAKLQGVGPGGAYADGTAVTGSIIDGTGFWAAGPTSFDPDPPDADAEPRANAWRTLVESLTWDGNQDVFDGEVVYVLAEDGEFGPSFPAAIDGFEITGGNQQGFPGNVNIIGGGPLPGVGGDAGAVTTQGGGIFLNAHANSFEITNNRLVGNGGSFGGAVRVGTPYVGDNHNHDVAIAHNRILLNGGTNLAGAIGIFDGADRYEVVDNELCGNFSTEYGGAISHFGMSPNGLIEGNRVRFNQAYDEGGGILVAGELPADPGALSPGAGPVAIRNNLVSSNLSNDDGGGLRFLMAGSFPYDVVNNVITNNVATHEGGGIALDDTPQVRIVNNTIAKNVTTATAITSDGLPDPAGVSTGANSLQLQATLPPGSSLISDPVLVNDIVSDNRSGTWTADGVTGIGTAGAGDIHLWGLGTGDGSGTLSPLASLLADTLGINPSATNLVGADPAFIDPQDTEVAVFPWRTFPSFRPAAIVSVDPHAGLPGDYHLDAGSPAIDHGIPTITLPLPFGGTLSAPLDDIDRDARPVSIGFDAGADERTGTATAGSVTPILDSFNRPNGPIGPSWAGTTAQNRIRILANTAQVRGAGTQLWMPDSFGPAQEARVTITMLPQSFSTTGLLLRVTGETATGGLGAASSYVEVAYGPYLNGIIVRTKNAGANPLTIRGLIPATITAGGELIARIDAAGRLSVLYRPPAGPTTLLGTLDLGTGLRPWTGAQGPGGRIGLRTTLTPGEARLDDFGGGGLL